jgi:methyl-accepting chemotaxis protein
LWAYHLRSRTIENAKNTILLKEQVENSQRSIAFAETISQGNLDVEYHFQDADELGQSLIKMRNSLLVAREKEEQDRFINKGMAEIGHLLRTHNESIENLSILICGRR